MAGRSERDARPPYAPRSPSGRWQLRQIVRGLRPLAMLPDGVLCHHRGVLSRVSLDLRQRTPLGRLPAAGVVRGVAQVARVAARVLRTCPTHAVVVGDVALVARRSEIWRCPLQGGPVTLDFRIPEGRRSLGLTVHTLPNGASEVVFGDYFANPAKRAAHLWGRAPDGRWTRRASFGEGEIEHVHTVAFVDDAAYVLTGDFGAAAGIWSADAQLRGLRPLLRGQQSVRAAWIAPLGGRVFFATDTQMEPNHLYELHVDSGTASRASPDALAGSSIYAGRGPREIFFSTTVECGEATGHFVRDLLDTSPGPGILSRSAALLSLDADGVVDEIFRAEKDAWPLRLAQFGTFLLPSGTMPPDTLIAYGVALEGVDDCCLLFRRS